MKKFILTILINFIIFVLYSQGNCEAGYFVVSDSGYVEIDALKMEKALQSLDKNCVESNAEFGEVVNEYLFKCLTYCSDTLFEVLMKNKCSTFYNIILNEIANPVSDAYDFKTIYCNIISFNKNKENKVRDEIFSKFKKGIASIIVDYKSILETDCAKK